ncbi:hypothetical protein OAF42_04080, partial [Planctomicrobium sp.]
ATGQVLLNDHIQCFVEVENSSAWSPSASGPLFGKAILYAANPFTMNVDLSAEISDYNEFPAFADLPQVGTSFNAGEPVCTVFAQGATIQQCRESISSMLQQLRERLES